jgi:uncharacterized membrane protein (UPF0127 family)
MSSLTGLFSRLTSFRGSPALKRIAANISAVRIADTEISVKTVCTRPAIDKGLSGLASFHAFPAEGMLFLFDHDARFKFWMRGMKFSLDIIWIDADMRVVDITRDAPPLPDTSEALFYSPSIPARYVLEVPAGFCASHEIQPGAVVEFLP